MASGGFKVGRPATVGFGGTFAGGPVTGSAGIPEPPTPDADGDGNVDVVDLNAFMACVTGPDIKIVTPACTDRDLDQDSDVDQVDFGIFQRCYSGSGNAFDRNCSPVVGNSVLPGGGYVELALIYDATAGKVTLTMNGNQLATYTSAIATGPRFTRTSPSLPTSDTSANSCSTVARSMTVS